MRRKTGTLSTYGFVVIAIIFSKMLGMGREMLLANFYGTTYKAAAFTAAARIPTIFFDITLGAAVASAFIPVFNALLSQEGRDRAFSFFRAFMGCAGLVAIVCTAGLMIFAPAAFNVMAPGYDEETTVLGVSLLRILAPVVLIAVPAFTVAGILQSLGEFKVPAIMSALCNGVVILYFFFLNDTFDIRGLAIALLLGWVLQLLVLLPALKKKGALLRPRLDFKDEGIKRAALLALPVLISSWVMPINTLIASNLSSYLGTRAGSSLNFAYQLYFIVAGVFPLALTNLFFPRMSRVGAPAAPGRLLSSLISVISVIVAPVMVFFILFGPSVTSLVYERGLFSAQDSTQVGQALSFYSLGMLSLSWQEILNKYFYSLHDSKTPMLIAFVGIGANIGLSMALMDKMGISGIALAASGTALIISVLLYFAACRRTGELRPAKTAASIFRILVCAALGGGVMAALFGPVMSWGPALEGGGRFFMDALKLIIVFAAGVACYGTTLYFLADATVRSGIKAVLGREE